MKLNSQIVTTDYELRYIKSRLSVPDNWSIFYASLDSDLWFQRAKRQSMLIGHDMFSSPNSPILFGRDNYQIASFGMGKLFVQIFTCAVERVVTDYRIAAKASGLSQLWPAPYGFWPFTKGSAKFPAQLRLKDEEADAVADAFYERTRANMRSSRAGILKYK